MAWCIKVLVILLLILIGLIVGLIFIFFIYDGEKLLELFFVESEKGIIGIFFGKYLFFFVFLVIGVIFFEGGFILKWKEIVGVGLVILKMIIVGLFIIFIGVGFFVYYIMEFNWVVFFLFGVFIIVIGLIVIVLIL